MNILRAQLYFYSLLSFLLIFPSKVLATSIINKKPEDVIGEITPPPGTEAYMADTGNANQLLPFISNLLTVVAVVAGIWVLINIFLAAYTAILSSGDAQAMQKVRNNITNSVIGLLLIVLAYTIAALAGAILFGDSNLFINPTF